MDASLLKFGGGIESPLPFVPRRMVLVNMLLQLRVLFEVHEAAHTLILD